MVHGWGSKVDASSLKINNSILKVDADRLKEDGIETNGKYKLNFSWKYPCKPET
jgi:hypothetical protein